MQALKGFQSTHPHGVRLTYGDVVSHEWLFQSTHPHGVRPTAQTARSSTLLFQSTHPHGVRQQMTPEQRARQVVSIHAPARGATAKRLSLPRWRRSFNPRTRTGCDYVGDDGRHYITVFQSTHPHGVRRLICLSISAVMPCFNPRTRTGCDAFSICSASV